MSHFSVPSENRILRILMGMQFAHMVDFVILMPLGPMLMKKFGIEATQFSFLAATYTFAAGLSGLFSSTFLDRFDRKKALLVVMAGFIVSTAACGFATDFWTLLSGRLLAGIFGGLTNTLVMSIIGDAIPYERRGRATGRVMSAFSVASVAGIPIGLYLATQYNWTTPFLLLSVMTVLLLLFTWFYMPSMRGHIPEIKSVKNPLQELAESWRLFIDPAHLRALSLTMALMLSGFSVIPFVSTYLVFNLGFPEKNLSFIFLFGGLVTFFSSRIVGFLSDKYGKHKTFMIMGALAMIPVLTLTNLHTSSMWAILTVTTFFFVFNNGRMVPAMTMITQTVTDSRRGRFMSLNTTVQHLTTSLATVIAGQIVFQPYEGAALQHYPFAGFFSVTFAMLAVWIGYRLKVNS